MLRLNRSIIGNADLVQIIGSGSGGNMNGSEYYYDPKALEYEINKSDTYSRKSPFNGSFKMDAFRTS